MLYCSFHRRSRHQPLSHSHQRLQSEGGSDPRSLASSVKTPWEQHPIFKESEMLDTYGILNKSHWTYVVTGRFSKLVYSLLAQSGKIQEKKHTF